MVDQNARRNIHLKVTPDIETRMERMLVTGNIVSKAELVRRALSCYEELLEHTKAGGKVILEGGEEEGVTVLKVNW